MQNDMLKNNITPFLEHNRWYKITLIPDGTVWKALDEESDIKNITISGGGTLQNCHFKEIDSMNMKLITNELKATSSASMNYDGRLRLYKISNATGYLINLSTTAPYEIDGKMIIYVHGLLI